MLDKQAIIKITKELGFSPEQYLVIAGTVLAIHSIRKASDVDMVVTPELFSQLKEAGEWQHSTRFEDNTEFLKKDNVEVASKLEWKDYPTSLAEAKSREDMIEGVPFMSLPDVIQFKQAYGRPKDFADIALIKEYLEANS